MVKDLKSFFNTFWIILGTGSGANPKEQGLYGFTDSALLKYAS
jgi:hypothetical protein